MKYTILRFDSVNGKFKKEIVYDDLKKAITYAKGSRDNVSIRDRETNETIMIFKYGEVTHDYK